MLHIGGNLWDTVFCGMWEIGNVHNCHDLVKTISEQNVEEFTWIHLAA